MCVAKTKALISCAVTAQLICIFDFAKAKIQFSRDMPNIRKLIVYVNLKTMLQMSREARKAVFGVSEQV